jgi:malate synthase
MPEKNQIRQPAEHQSRITEKDLLEIPSGHITEAGLRRNIDVALQYIESWLRGNGCVPIYNLMEDAATAEISRAQLWQWIRYGATLDDCRVITAPMCEEMLAEILQQTQRAMGAAYENSKFERAAELLTEFSTGEFQEFLTSAAYREIK